MDAFLIFLNPFLLLYPSCINLFIQIRQFVKKTAEEFIRIQVKNIPFSQFFCDHNIFLYVAGRFLRGPLS